MTKFEMDIDDVEYNMWKTREQGISHHKTQRFPFLLVFGAAVFFIGGIASLSALKKQQEKHNEKYVQKTADKILNTQNTLNAVNLFKQNIR